MASAADRPGLSRRALLTGLGALGAASLLESCGTGSAAPSALPETAATGRAARGGVLRVARPPASSAETVDPASALCAYEYLGALYNKLVKTDRTGRAVPDLAESWDVTPDARTWTFHLRRGVTFHDGRPFTAADAAYTLRHILDPATASPQAGVFAPLLDPAALTTPDEHTLVVPLRTANAEFPSLLTSYNCYVIPDGTGDRIGATGIGTGPFRLESFTPAGRGRVVRNPDYWDGTPVLDAIEFYAVADTQARSNALLAGQIDLISQTNLDFATARVVNASSKATVARVPYGQWYVLPMLCTAEPFTDVRVRRAMKLAYDPAAVLDLAAQGTGTVAHDNPVPPDHPYWTDYSVPRDPDRARYLLKRAGHDGLRVELYTSGYDPLFTPMALAYQDSVAEAGIRVELRTVTADSYYTDVWMKQPLCATYWYTGRPIDQLFNQIFRSGTDYNETAWSDPRFDGLLDAARRELDPDRRRRLYQDAQRHVVDNGGAITPMFADRLVGISRDVVNYAEYGFEFDYVGIGFRAGS